MTEKFYGNYLGIVVQTNDPEKRGRVKVFVPHISYNLYKNWNEIELDKLFTNLQDADISNVLQDLKRVLPWAEVAGPLFGGNSSGRYNASTKKVYSSNTNQWIAQGDSQELIQGNRPGARFTGIGSLRDGFNDATNTKVLNPYSFEYTPSDYSGLAAGAFTIPNVGSHVWVFFQNGDFNAPVYWASAYGEADYKRIYTNVKFTDTALQEIGEDAVNQANVSVDYPSDYENTFKPQIDSESKTFRAKHVINTNKHTIELVDTDNREILKLTHFSGSFKEWNNNVTVEFASNNDQKLVLGNQFETVRKDKNVYVTGGNRQFVDGDVYLRVGNFDYQTVSQIKDIVSEINEFKLLFDTKRIGFEISGFKRGVKQRLSDITGVNAVSVYQKQEAFRPGEYVVGGVTYRDGFVHCPVCKNKSYKVKQSRDWVTGYDYELGESGFYEARLIDPEDTVVYKDLKKLETVPGDLLEGGTSELGVLPGRGIVYGAVCDVCNSDYIAAELRRYGFNTSTEHGLFKHENRKTDREGRTLIRRYNAQRNKLNKLLAECSGGDHISEIHNNKVVTVGLVMNDSMSYRVDPIGKLRAESVYVAAERLYTSGKPTPHIEPVDVSEVPGGNYIVTATNKLKFIVGAKGVNIKTFGPLDMYGTIVNFTGEQLNISSQNEINIDGGEKVFIRSRKTVIASRDHEPVLIEAPLHVTRNFIVNGGAYIDGEVGINHISSIREFALTSGPILNTAQNASDVPYTESLEANNQATTSNLIGSTPGADTSGFEAQVADLQTSFQAQAAALQTSFTNHVHMYERIPTNFFDSAESLRAYLNDPGEHDGAVINSRSRTIAAKPTSAASGKYTEVVRRALEQVGFNNVVAAAVRAAYASGAANPVQVPCIIERHEEFEIKKAAELTEDRNAVKAQIFKTFKGIAPIDQGNLITFGIIDVANFGFEMEIPIENIPLDPTTQPDGSIEQTQISTETSINTTNVRYNGNRFQAEYSLEISGGSQGAKSKATYMNNLPPIPLG